MLGMVIDTPLLQPETDTKMYCKSIVRKIFENSLGKHRRVVPIKLQACSVLRKFEHFICVSLSVKCYQKTYLTTKLFLGLFRNVKNSYSVKHMEISVPFFLSYQVRNLLQSLANLYLEPPLHNELQKLILTIFLFFQKHYLQHLPGFAAF